MDISQNLKDAENSLRDFIYQILKEKYKEEWEIKCLNEGSNRVEIWKGKREVERKKNGKTGAIDERLLYYADFYDLESILEKNWILFTGAFGKEKDFLPYLKILEDFRNPNAHGRELFPHQKNLIIGISGEIRAMIARYRSKNESEDDYFPKIECVQESLGRTWIPDNISIEDKEINIRVGDEVQFVITSTDPKFGKIEYLVSPYGKIGNFNLENTISYIFKEEDIGRITLAISIKSNRTYHKYGRLDDSAFFPYLVLPKELNYN